MALSERVFFFFPGGQRTWRRALVKRFWETFSAGLTEGETSVLLLSSSFLHRPRFYDMLDWVLAVSLWLAIKRGVSFRLSTSALVADCFFVYVHALIVCRFRGEKEKDAILASCCSTNKTPMPTV